MAFFGDSKSSWHASPKIAIVIRWCCSLCFCPSFSGHFQRDSRCVVRVGRRAGDPHPSQGPPRWGLGCGGVWSQPSGRTAISGCSVAPTPRSHPTGRLDANGVQACCPRLNQAEQSREVREQGIGQECRTYDLWSRSLNAYIARRIVKCTKRSPPGEGLRWTTDFFGTNGCGRCHSG